MFIVVYGFHVMGGRCIYDSDSRKGDTRGEKSVPSLQNTHT